MYAILIVIGFIILSSIRQISEYERGVLFTFGKFSKILKPGWRIILPIIQSYKNLNLKVNGVIKKLEDLTDIKSKFYEQMIEEEKINLHIHKIP